MKCTRFGVDTFFVGSCIARQVKLEQAAFHFPEVFWCLTVFIHRILPSVIAQLKHPNVDVRIQAGETLAHFFEMGRDYNPDFDDSVSGKL